MISKQMLPYLFGQGRVVFGLQVSTAMAQQGAHSCSTPPSLSPFPLEVRRSKYSTEDDLAPRFEILQGRARLGVKYAETLGYRFVALEGRALDPLGWRLPFMPDGL